MTEEKLVLTKKQYKVLLENLDKGNQIGIMKNGELIKLAEYDSETEKIIEVMLIAVIRGLEK